jgi:uncharacterized protein
MEIPYLELSEEALRGVIEEYISREGTDYGEHEYSFEDKIEQVKRQLKQGEVKLNFDPDSQSCNLYRRDLDT